MTRRDLQRSDPRLGPGGVLIVDNYAWQGVRQAVDRYNGEHAPRLLLSRIDYAGRITVQLEPRGVRV